MPQGRRHARRRDGGLSAVQAQGPASRAELVFFFAVAGRGVSSMSRRRLRAARTKGEIEFLLGKPELVAKGHFDDIDRPSR